MFYELLTIMTFEEACLMLGLDSEVMQNVTVSVE